MNIKKAPRKASIYKNCYSTLENCYYEDDKQVLTGYFFKNLKKKYKQFRGWPNSRVKKVVKGFCDVIADAIINEREGVILPANICTITLVSKSGVKSIDYKLSTKEETCYHTNEHTGGMSCTLYTVFRNTENGSDAYKPSFENSKYWKFVASEKFQRSASTAYIKDWKKYKMISNNSKWKAMQENYVYKKKINNEFDF